MEPSSSSNRPPGSARTTFARGSPEAAAAAASCLSSLCRARFGLQQTRRRLNANTTKGSEQRACVVHRIYAVESYHPRIDGVIVLRGA